LREVGIEDWVWTKGFKHYGSVLVDLLPDRSANQLARGTGPFFWSNRMFCYWLPPRDSNPDMLIQSQLSYH
jgi:hypothetical protein